MFVDMLIAANPEFFTGRIKGDIQAYITEVVAFMERKIGRGNIFSAVVHMDERTPHLHLRFTPGRATIRQGDFGQLGAALQVAGRVPRLHEKGVPRPQAGGTVGDSRAILRAAGNPFGADEEVPGLDYLTQENKGSKEKVNDGNSIKQKMEVIALKQENETLRCFVDSISPEVMQALKQQQREAERTPAGICRMKEAAGSGETGGQNGIRTKGRAQPFARCARPFCV